MTAPLSVKAESHVDVENSCNCCIPKKKHKHKNVTTVTEEIRHRTIVQVDSTTPETSDSRQYTQLK